MMAYGRERKPQGWVRSVLVVVGLFILLIFVVDKLVLDPGAAPPRTAAPLLQRLQRHDVRRVTIHTSTVSVEAKDGTTFSASLPADRDLGPALRESGAEIVVLSGRTAPGPSSSPLAAVFQFVPYVITALLLLFTLRRRTSSGTR